MEIKWLFEQGGLMYEIIKLFDCGWHKNLIFNIAPFSYILGMCDCLSFFGYELHTKCLKSLTW